MDAVHLILPELNDIVFLIIIIMRLRYKYVDFDYSVGIRQLSNVIIKEVDSWRRRPHLGGTFCTY